MDINRKKVILIPESVLTEIGGLTDLKLRRDILNRIRNMNVQRVAIILSESEDEDYISRVKTMEFFVFSYCKTAVSSHHRGDTLLDEITAMLPHSLRKRECMLSVGEKTPMLDYISVEDFV